MPTVKLEWSARMGSETRNFISREDAVFRMAILVGYTQGREHDLLDLGEHGLIIYPRRADPILNATVVIRGPHS